MTFSTKVIQISLPNGSGSMPGSATTQLIGNNETWKATVNNSWLTMSPMSGKAGATPATLTVTATNPGKTAGKYVGTITIQFPGGFAYISVTAIILPVPPVDALKVTPAALNFSDVAGDSSGHAQQLHLSHPGPSPIAVSVMSDSPWLIFSGSSMLPPGNVDDTVSVAVAAGALAVGVYHGALTITAAGLVGSPITVPVTLNVTVPTPPPPPPPPPIDALVAAPAALVFSVAAAGGVAPAPQTVALTRKLTSSNVLAWAVTDNQPWLTITPAAGPGLPGSFTVAVDPTGLAAGLYTGSVLITAAPLVLTIPVSFQVGAIVLTGLHLKVRPDNLSFNAAQGSPAPAPLSIAIGSDSVTGPVPWTAIPGDAWISIFPASGVTGTTAQISVDPSKLTPGQTYAGGVRFKSPGVPDGWLDVAVNYTVPVPVGQGGVHHIRSQADFLAVLGTPGVPTPSGIKSGDVILLHAMTVKGSFKSYLTGAAANPIIVKNAPGEQFTIDIGAGLANRGAVTGPGLEVHGTDVWYMGDDFGGGGFEIMNSLLDRSVPSAGSFSLNGDAIGVYGARNKFINLFLHDTEQGCFWGLAAPDCEINGGVICYNGWSAPDRPHGHAIYSQNQTGSKLIQGVIAHHGFDMGPRIYGTGASYAVNIHFLDNVSTMHGNISEPLTTLISNYLLTMGSGVKGGIFKRNHSYFKPELKTGYVQLGWQFSAVEFDLDATDNYFLGGGSSGMPVEIWNWNTLNFQRNMILGLDLMAWISRLPQQGANWTVDNNQYFGSGLMRWMAANTSWAAYKAASKLDANSTYTPGKPAGVNTFIIPSVYTPGRANVVIHNWDAEQVVPVDVSSVLKAGQQYELRDSYNYKAVLLSGTFDGSPLQVPMAGLPIAPPVGKVPSVPIHTAPEFGAFVLLGK